jgi:hypothetical protein
MALVFRFRTWDIANDCFQESRRWATKEAIERVMGEIISDGIEVDDRFFGQEIDGMTIRGSDPRYSPSPELQTRAP